MTYPVVLFLQTKVLGGAEDNFHFLWELWYVAHALFDLHKSPFFDPDVYVPFGFSLIRNQDLSPGTVLLFSPLTQLFGEVFTYNFLVLASFPLTALGTYLLAREMWSNRLAAFLAGVIVGFCPYRFTHATGHLSIVSTEWIPFFFLYLERLISKPRLKSAVLTGAFFGLSAWTTWYYFFMVLIAATFYIAFRINWNLPLKSLWHLLKLGFVSFCVALVLVLPFLVPYYLATHGGVVDYRGPGESQAFAAALADYIIPPTTHFLWGSKVNYLWRRGPNGLWQSEWQLYLGAVTLLLAVAGVFHRRRRVVIGLLALAVGCLIFSFGPGVYLTHPPPISSSTNDVALSFVPAPGRWLRQLPGFNNLRGWARLGFFVELSVGLLAAAGLAHVLDWTKHRLKAPGSIQVGVVALATGFVLLDFWPRPQWMSSVAPRAVEQWLANQPGKFVVMEYPIPRHGYGGLAIYSTRLTGKRIIMGSSQNPPNFSHWSDLSAFPSPVTLDLLYGWGARYILVDENLYRAGSSFWNIYQTWNTLEPAIKASGRLTEVTTLNGVHVYQLHPGTDEGGELLRNGSFEEGRSSSLPGWQITGKPKFDRTGNYAFGGRTGCAVTVKDFLVSAPIAVRAGECYRLSIREIANSPKLGKARLQIAWKNQDEAGVEVPNVLVTDLRSAGQWQESSMIVRAPAQSSHAVVEVGAASGKLWVDDCSFKKIPVRCEPVLFVTPNPVSITGQQPGRATISWNCCCSSEGYVTLRLNDTSEKLVASGQSGIAFLDGIKPGESYRIQLYSRPQSIAVRTASLTAIPTTAIISAQPNPVPAGSGVGKTNISWATVDNTDAEVFVSRDGGPEQLFARGPAGSIEAGWIASGSSYEFRLYSRDVSRRLLAHTTVTR